MRLFLIRHAQSANNALPEEQRIEDPPITEVGCRQACALAHWLESAGLDWIVASPFRRSLETTEYVRRNLAVTPRVWIDLHEQGGCYAGYEPHLYQGRPGLSLTQIAVEFPGYELDPAIDEEGWWKCRPYETAQQASNRAARLIDRTLVEFGASNLSVAYIMHADFKRKFLETLFPSVDDQTLVWADIYNTAVTIIEFQQGSPRLEVYNSTAHLTPDLLTL
jgi:2,3-bisphosphoglycerate-dependent phosphoglycerate mutase